MNRLLIVGAGNFGREVMDWALAVPPEKRDWELEGFLDNRADVVESLDAPYPVLGDPDTFEFTERHRFICALGESAARLEYGRRLRARGARFITLIHPTATIGSNCSWGVGCIFCPGTIITNHVTLGDFVALNCYATVGHDAVLGDGCTLGGHAVVKPAWLVLPSSHSEWPESTRSSAFEPEQPAYCGIDAGLSLGPGAGVPLIGA